MPGPGKRNCGNTSGTESLWETVDSALKEAEELNRSRHGDLWSSSEGPELYLDALQKDLDADPAVAGTVR